MRYSVPLNLNSSNQFNPWMQAARNLLSNEIALARPQPDMRSGDVIHPYIGSGNVTTIVVPMLGRTSIRTEKAIPL